MRKNMTRTLVICWLSLAAAACNANAPAAPNTQATIDAAIAATGNAQLANQATIDAAVQATGNAQTAGQATVDAAVQATEAAQATPTEPVAQAADASPATPVPSEEYVTMTEEELAALIDQTVNEAVVATEQYAVAATEAAADNTVSPEEVQTIEVYVAGAEEAIALAEELIYIYYDLYGDLATETITAIEEINQSLLYIAEYTDEMTAVLVEINSALEQGLVLAEETIAGLEAAAQAAGAQAEDINAQIQAWADIRQTQIGGSVLEDILAVQPNQIAADPSGATQSAFEFIGAAQQALADGAVSADELATLAQLGANAGAGLAAQGSPQLQQLSGAVNGVIGQLANGDIAQAQAALSQLGVDTALSVQPNQVPGDLQSAIQCALNFADTGHQALADGNISAAELANLAQLGANAGAGLNAQGGPQLQQFSGSINQITEQIARGDVPQAQETLNGLGNSLGAIQGVDRPSVPEIEKPSLPGRK